MSKKKELPSAHHTELQQCECGCGIWFIYLVDAAGNDIARFGYPADQFIEVARQWIALIKRDERIAAGEPHVSH